jgi:hypothetical protein
MILHTGIDGGLHDAVATNIWAALAWGSLGLNAIVFYAREAWRRWGRKK